MPFPVNPALEAAVAADADSDVPRLAYADWLDEHGDPLRAAFIRAQCRLAGLSPADDGPPFHRGGSPTSCSAATGGR